MEKHQYKILIEDRNYSSWTLYNPLTFEELYKKGDEGAPIPPAKYFNKDIFEFCPVARSTKIIHSQTCESELAGILVLDGNRTYGRTKNGKRMLYRCIPDDVRLPEFLVPYDQKLGFSKKSHNKYILFKFVEWGEKHPHGIITQNLGDVNSLEAFYIYQLYRKSLQIPIADFSQKIRKCLAENCGEAAQIQSTIRNHPEFVIGDNGCNGCNGVFTPARIITIDNANTVDYDDAISIRSTSGGKHIVSIYITNIVYVLETLDLWSSLTKRVATIYLPDGRRPMLPSLLTDSLCSLQAGKPRFCLVCDIEIADGKITGANRFYTQEIYVDKNFSYFSPELEEDHTYRLLFKETLKLSPHIKQSNDVISFWMIKMNTLCAERMAAGKYGIFRAPPKTENLPLNLPETLDNDTRHVIETWSYTSGQYVTSAFPTTYIHITSPIRRLVDLLNQIMFMENEGLLRKKSKSAAEFLEKWMGELDYINTAMRAIKKIQTDCYLLEKCVTCPEVLEKTYQGIVFDKIERRNDCGICTYMVYLKELRLLSRVSVLCSSPESDMENYSCANFKICLFEDKVSLRQKIKLAIK